MPKNNLVLAASRLLICLLATLPPAAAGASTPSQGGSFIIDSWESDDGLPGNTITSIAQTRDGYLWLGTLNGLVRFDGIRFTVFDESNTPGLNSSQIIALFADRKDNLWVGTETTGVALIHNGRVTQLGIGDGNRNSRLASICEDQNGTVWLLTADGELWRHHEGRTRRISVTPQRPYTTLACEQNGNLWLGARGGLAACDPATLQDGNEWVETDFIPVSTLDYLLGSPSGGYWRLADGNIFKWNGNRVEAHLGSYQWNSESGIAAACEDNAGNLWVGTRGSGLFRFDLQGNVAAISAGEGLSYRYILSLHFDPQGNLWVGTDGGGLNRLKPHVFDTVESTLDSVVQSVAEDDEGGLWIGTNGKGVSYLKDNQVQAFGPTNGLFNPYIRTVFVDRGQKVWVGTRGGSGPFSGLFNYENGRFRKTGGENTNDIYAIHQDRNGTLWVGTGNGLNRARDNAWTRFGTKDGLSASVVQALADDRQGNLWIGTVGGGLNRYQDGRFTAFTTRDGLPSDDISSLFLDDNDVLWIGTFGRGLVRMDRGQWTHYTTDEGLISNNIGYIIEDDLDHLWIGSNAGLMRVEKRELNDFARGLTRSVRCRAFGQPDGLPIRECTRRSQPGACRTAGGRLWFPTIKGLTSVDPSQLKPNPHPPPVIIESTFLDNHLQASGALHARLPDTITVPPSNQRLDIQYTAFNLTAPDRTLFRYRMEGHETDWTDAGQSRVARYRKLPPGRYRFVVTASNEDGLWNPTGASIAVVVPPPYWRTWWFLSLVTLTLLGGTAGTVHYISTQKLQRELQGLKLQEELETERKRIARDLHDQLGASLTQVSLLGELIESDRHHPQEVAEHARQVTQTALETTRVFDEIVWAVNPSNDTLESLITYVCKYAQDYLGVAGLKYRIEVPPEVPNAVIPPEVRHNVFLAAKEAVTNIVRHAHASSVWIRLQLTPARFTLEIADDGRGIPEERKETTRNGLRNMSNRMEELGGSCSIGTAPQGGTLVRLTAPIGKAAP